jgi:hypothetical protein
VKSINKEVPEVQESYKIRVDYPFFEANHRVTEFSEWRTRDEGVYETDLL